MPDWTRRSSAASSSASPVSMTAASKRVGELAANHRADLGNFLGVVQAVEPSHERGLQSRRNHRFRRLIVLGKVALDHGLGQFLDIERDAVGTDHDAVDNRFHELLAADRVRDLRRLLAPKTAQGHVGLMRIAPTKRGATSPAGR